MKAKGSFVVAAVIGVVTVGSVHTNASAFSGRAILAGDDNEREILKCFHPEGASFTREQGEWDCEKDAHSEKEKGDCLLAALSGDANYSGTIFYRGKLTNNAYHMDYALRFRTRQEGKRYFTEVRVTPAGDTAPFAPNSECELRWWTRIRD